MHSLKKKQQHLRLLFFIASAFIYPLSAWGEDTIAVAPLEAPSPDILGTLSQKNGGLGDALWADTRRKQAESYLADLQPVASPALRKLENILLLSTSQPPHGKGTHETLIGLRLDALFRFGNLQGFNGLYTLTPSRYITDDIHAKKYLLMLLDEEASADKVCPEIEERAKTSSEPSLRQLLAFCQLTHGKNDEALLTLSLLQEDFPKVSSWAALIDLVSSKKRNTTVSTIASPVDFLFYRFLNLPLAESFNTKALSPILAKAVAGYSHAPGNIRITAAEEAFHSGVTTAEYLASVYSGQVFDKNLLKKAGVDSVTLAPEKERALFFQAASQSTGTEKLYKIHATLQIFAKYDRLDLGYALFRNQIPEVATLPATIDSATLAFIPDAVKMLLLSPQNEDQVNAWYESLRKHPIHAAKDSDSHLYLSFLMAIAALPSEETAQPSEMLPWHDEMDKNVSSALTDWWQDAVETGHISSQINDKTLLALMYSTTKALGGKIPYHELRRYASLPPTKQDTSPAPDIGTIIALKQANTPHPRLADTVHLATSLMKDISWQTTPIAQAAIIQGLLGAGLHNTAKAFALETLIYYDSQ